MLFGFIVSLFTYCFMDDITSLARGHCLYPVVQSVSSVALDWVLQRL